MGKGTGPLKAFIRREREVLRRSKKQGTSDTFISRRLNGTLRPLRYEPSCPDPFPLRKEPIDQDTFRRRTEATPQSLDRPFHQFTASHIVHLESDPPDLFLKSLG